MVGVTDEIELQAISWEFGTRRNDGVRDIGNRKLSAQRTFSERQYLLFSLRQKEITGRVTRSFHKKSTAESAP